MPASPTEVFHRVLAGVTGRRWAELPDLYAEDTVVEHPFAVPHGTVMRGREALRKHFAAGGELGLTMTAEDVVVHQTTDPEVVAGEFTYRGTVDATGTPFTVRNIFVMRVRDGLIVESRDYHDHLSLAAATGRLESVVDAYHPIASQ
jgi:ketosteroid isomerase-like protein